MAPEILEKKEYDEKCDLWSIGIIIYRLLFFNSPFSGYTETALIKNIKKLGNNKLKKSGNKELDDLIKKLLEKDPEKRINWANYFNHPFFNDSNRNCTYEILREDYPNYDLPFKVIVIGNSGKKNYIFI